jgi:hypothetical protein
MDYTIFRGLALRHLKYFVIKQRSVKTGTVMVHPRLVLRESLSHKRGLQFW